MHHLPFIHVMETRQKVKDIHGSWSEIGDKLGKKKSRKFLGIYIKLPIEYLIQAAQHEFLR